jgi:fermentation-respiration switch protein FrsA (DUF1100 family)
VILYFHGNGGALRYRVVSSMRYRRPAQGFWPGLCWLGARPGHRAKLASSPCGAAYGYAAARYPPQRIVLWGESLGGAVAVALAAEREVARVVLEAPFSSAVDIAAAVYPIVPVRLLMKDQFRSDLRIGKVKAPVLILHGERDTVIPIGSGERLYGLIRSPKRFARFRDGGHEDLASHGAIAAAKAFLNERFE